MMQFPKFYFLSGTHFAAKMATDIMAPLIEDINSRLTEDERTEAKNRFCSVYGSRYSSQKDLLSLLSQCVKENKINPLNTLPLQEGLSSAEGKRSEIRDIVERFKDENSSTIKEWERNQPSEFVGRDIGWLGSILESRRCVVLWGASGVGKTKLAYTYMKSRNDIDHKVVDLRGIKSMEVIYVEALKQFGKLVSIEDVSQGLVANTVKNHVINNKSLLLLDNADDFVCYSGEGANLTSEFASLVKGILEQCSPHNLRIIVTSRHQSEHPDASVLHQEQLMSLKDEDASGILKSRMLHERDKDSRMTNEVVKKAVEQCRNLPLNLKVVAAALQEQGNKLENILPIIVKKAQEWKIAKQAEKVELSEEDFYTYAVLASRFEQLSDTLQLAGVALSLFTRSFSFRSVAAVLIEDEKKLLEEDKKEPGKEEPSKEEPDKEEPDKEQVKKEQDHEVAKINLIVNYLKGIHFLNEETESVYDMHPKVREFLISKITSSPSINEYYVKAKQKFTVYYREKLTNISKLVDKDYVKAYDLYMESSSDFDFIFSEKDNEFILVDDYDDNQNIVALLHGMLMPEQRLKLFENFAETAFRRGNILPATQHLCHTVLAESFYNPVETFEFTLLRVQHTLETIRGECTSRSRKNRLDHLYGLYHYVRGEVLYRMIRVNFSLEDCETAMESLEKSISIREKLDEKGSTDIVRSYINLGNIYNITEDVHRRNKNFDATEPYLEKALDVYNKALEMRLRLSRGGLHVDIPQIQSSIGTIWNERGLLLQPWDRRAKRRGENEKALEYFRQAEMCFKQSLETEKELNLGGLYETSVKLVNMGDVQRYLKKPKEAVGSLIEALELRRIFKGDHEDTVLVLYRLGNISMEMEEFKEAAGYYREGFEMDERLPKNFHSAVRKEIRKYLILAYQKWGDRDRKESKRIKQERKDLEKKIKELEKKEKKEDKESANQAKGIAAGLKLKGGELDRSKTDFQTSMEACDKYVDGEFDKRGGHLAFKYINTSLTIPRNLVQGTHALRICRMKEEDVEINLSDSEFLVSDIIRVDSKFNGNLKSPAMLEIRCDVLESRIEGCFDLFMLEYDPVSKDWIDVERTAYVRRRFYWHEKNDHVPIIQGWINRFSMFAIVIRPKKYSFSVPYSGLVWRPVEDGSISLDFPSGCFSEASKCEVKVVHPEPTIIRYAHEKLNLLLSPAINVNSKESIAMPIRIALPLLDFRNKPKKEGFLKILKKEDNSKANFEIEDLNPVFKDNDETIVEVEVSGFSWIMAAWTLKEIGGEILKWIGDKVLRHFQYDVDVNVFKRTAVDDSIIIGVSCTQAKTSDPHWLERHNLQVPGYEFVNSAPALERLDDGSWIRVEVKGQYIIAKSDNNSLRFNSRNFSPTPLILKENPLMDKERWMYFHRVENDMRLCGIPYHKNFKLTSDSDAERAAYVRNKTLRFLGMKLEKSSLECLHAGHNPFRNSLYKTGLDEDFVDKLKMTWEADGRKMVARELLEEITRLFTADELAENWFSVFEESTHPDSLRKNLINVMKILNDRLVDRDWRKIEAAIEDGNVKSKFLQDLSSRLQEKDREPKLDFNGAMKEYVIKKHTIMDLVRRILRLQGDGYLEKVDNVLDKIGVIIENWMPGFFN